MDPTGRFRVCDLLVRRFLYMLPTSYLLHFSVNIVSRAILRYSIDLTIHQLFMAAVGLIFAPLAPLVAAMACVIFWSMSLSFLHSAVYLVYSYSTVSSLVYKYQLMFVFVTRVESGGVRSLSSDLYSTDAFIHPALMERRDKSSSYVRYFNAIAIHSQ